MKKLANAIRVVAVNLIVLVVLMGGIEFYFRHWGHEQPDGLLNGLWRTIRQRPAVATAPAAPAASASAAPANTEQSEWDYLVGLTVKDETAEKPVVAGFQPRRLTATSTASRHGLGVRFDDLKPGGTYHVTVWLKSTPNAWAMVEGRDSNDPQTGTPVHFGVVSFDLQKAVTTKSSGDLAKLSVAAAKDGWVKTAFDLVTKDGRIYVTANLLEGGNGLMNFQDAGQNVVFGGVEIEERK